ncbi:MAG: hypothetical protein JST06_10450 [Bacteroidetes bacterium]|nr:hypothetical protein [Bacteroidota bacterium]
MYFLHKAAFACAFCCPLWALGQIPDAEIPLPQTDAACIVLKIRYDFPWKPGGVAPNLDTVGLFIVGDGGLLRIAYFSHAGYCQGEETFQYNKNNRLICKTGYRSVSLHSPLARERNHQHELSFSKTWSYHKGKVSSLRYCVGPKLVPAEITQYEYDDEGRLSTENNSYPQQSEIVFPTYYDEVEYSYDQDSVTRLCYRQGILKDSSTYYAHRNPKGQMLERWEPAAGAAFTHEWFQYDSLERLSIYRCQKDYSPLRRDGSIAYPDRIERSYDERGRLVAERFFAREIKRWAFQYIYIE